MFCKKCGASIPEGSMFCTSCGQKIAEESGTPTQPLASGMAGGTIGTPPDFSQPGYTPPPGAVPIYPPVPKKPKRTGMIVLVSVLAVAAAAAIVLLCLKILAPAKEEPADFADVYDTLMQSALVSGTSQPSATPTQTTAPSSTQTTLDMPFDFVTMDYSNVAHTGQAFDSIGSFESALSSGAWYYKEAHGNPNAVSFNNGFVDIGNKDTLTYSEYTFRTDYSISYYQLNAADQSVLNEADYTYWTQDFDGVYKACIDTGYQTSYNGTMYDVIAAIFIDTNGDLVESMAIYDPYSEDFIELSNYNIYAQQQPIIDNGHTPTTWASQDDFEQTLLGYVWTYMRTDPEEPAIVVDAYSDITPYYMTRLVFNSDSTVESISSDPDTEEIISDDATVFTFGNYHAYVYIEMYEYEGTEYEVDFYYYIDENGYLIERIMFYNVDAGGYYPVTNTNIYEPVFP